jgi:hypothetical protein
MLSCKLNITKKRIKFSFSFVFSSDIANQIGIEQNILDFGQVYLHDDLTTNSKTLKLTIKNYSRTDPCDVRIKLPYLNFNTLHCNRWISMNPIYHFVLVYVERPFGKLFPCKFPNFQFFFIQGKIICEINM